jgi:uncharacterized protein
VAADVAFLAMDLDERGCPDLSQAFVDAYIEDSGDHGLFSVLDFYKCYRAFVQAKVECFRLNDPMVTAGEKRAAYRYCQLAARYADALQRPWLLISCGLMGTGKSILAETLAQRLDLQVLSSDVTRKRQASLQPTAPSRAGYGEGLYTDEWTEATYKHLFGEAERCLSRGQSVLIDASFQPPPSPARRAADGGLGLGAGAVGRLAMAGGNNVRAQHVGSNQGEVRCRA